MEDFALPLNMDDMGMPPALVDRALDIGGTSVNGMIFQEPHSDKPVISDDYAPVNTLKSSENVITLVDSSGREFHTNLRASDIEYLMKYNIISRLREELRSTKVSSTNFSMNFIIWLCGFS